MKTMENRKTRLEKRIGRSGLEPSLMTMSDDWSWNEWNAWTDDWGNWSWTDSSWTGQLVMDRQFVDCFRNSIDSGIDGTNCWDWAEANCTESDCAELRSCLVSTIHCFFDPTGWTQHCSDH